MALTQEELDKLIGTKCGKLTVVEYLGYYAQRSKQKRHWYKCLCECGTYVEVDKTHLNPLQTKKATTSCGCSRNRHGLSKHPCYHIWKCMVGRVDRPDPYRHKHYIENNIDMCEEWRDPAVFIEWALSHGWEEGLTIDRIDNTKGYYPDNCRFATKEQQSNNRPSYNHTATYNGKTQTLSQWSRELGMAEGTLRSRIDRGMSVEEAFTKPIDKRFSYVHNGKKIKA